MNDLELTQITDARDTPIVIHGTSKKAWETIQHEVYLHLYILYVDCWAKLANVLVRYVKVDTDM